MSEGERPAKRPVRRTSAAPAPPPEVAPATAGAEVAPPDPRGVSLTVGFFGCLAIGLGFCLLGLSPDPTLKKIGLIGPVAATALYPLWGWVSGTLRRQALRERFGDNCYYLGFIFTQAALLFAFLPITMWGRSVSSEDVLGFFGMAVGASLTGLIARTLIVQTGKTVPEADDSMHREVEDLARQVSHRARSIVGEFDTLSRSVAAVPEAMAARLDVQLTAIAGTLSRYDDVLRTEISSFESGAAAVTRAAEEAAASYLIHQQSFGDHVKGVSESLDRLREGLAGRLDETLDIVRAGTSSIAEAVAALGGLAGTREDVAAVRLQVAGLTVHTRAVAADIAQSRDMMDRAAAAAVAALDASSGAGAAKLSAAAEAGAGALQASADVGATRLSQAAEAAADTIDASSQRGLERLAATAERSAVNLEAVGTRTATAIAGQAEEFTRQLGEATNAFTVTLTQFREELRRLRSESDAAGAEG
ncbi:MAG TPA: hypothetical protein VFZ91_07035 [Allosphingosinicella sp.]